MLLRSHTASSEKKAMKLVYALVLIALPFRALAADSTGTIPPGSKVYVREMDGFGSYITTAISKKRVQVVIVSDREMADYEIGGGAVCRTDAGWRACAGLRPGGEAEQPYGAIAD